jgi:hypothetical protein
MRFLDELAKQMEQLDGKVEQLRIPMALDDDGYLDRLCPSGQCHRGFKVLWADEAKFAQTTWCTYCGHTDEHASFFTAEQREHVAAFAQERAAQMFHDAMTTAARRTPKAPRRLGKGLTIKEDVRVPARRPRELTVPAAWSLMGTRASCEQCACRFAAIGSPCFCPACGHRSPELTFEQTLRRLRVSLGNRGALEAAVGIEAATDIMSSVLEDGIRALVTAFEAFAKDSYARLAPTAPAPPKNVFQRLDQGSDLWRRGGGRSFDVILSAVEIADLRRYFQQRHLVVHRNGIVDDEYLRLTGDNAYRLGQRLSIRATDVEHMLQVVERLVSGMRDDLAP